MRDTRIDMEPKAMGQLKAEAAKKAHESMMSGEDSVGEMSEEAKAAFDAQVWPSFSKTLADSNAREEADRRLIREASKVEAYGYVSSYRGSW